MRLLLVFPPFTDASQPNAAIPSLVTALDDPGLQVEVLDANLESWEYLLDARRQARWRGRAEARLRDLDRRPQLDDRQRAAYLAILDGCLRGEAASSCLGSALETLRSERFYSPRCYRLAQQAVRGALALVSGLHHPARLEWGRFWPACRVQSSREVVRAAADRRTNPFVRYAAECFLPHLRKGRPHLVGFSLTYLDQVVPALTLARACRLAFPRARIVFGGQIVSLWGQDLLQAPALWPWVDFFVRGEGEVALPALVRHLRDGEPLEEVPNLIVPAAPVRETPIRRESLRYLSCPDYSCVPLRRYLSPEPVLLVSASRGCYWGRCRFCSVSPGFRPGYRVRPTASVLRDLEQLRSVHGVRCVMFGDDAIPPTLLRDLAAQEAGRGGPLFWQAEVRADALQPGWIKALARAGARNLVIGLESGNDQVLQDMDKGVWLAHTRRILEACQRAGVGVNLQCFLGFPTETLDQARDTVRFVQEFLGDRVTVSCGKFVLVKGSPLWCNPGSAAIRLPPGEPGDDLAVQHGWRPRYGLGLQQRLIQQLEGLAGTALAPQLGCGINAHALLFITSTRAAPDAPSAPFDPRADLRFGAAAAYRALAWDPGSLRPGRRPVRRRTTVALSLTQSVMRLLGPLSATLCRACRRPVRGEDLLAGLTPAERRLIRRRLWILARQGLVENPAGTRTDQDDRRASSAGSTGRSW